jgi:hypothetical protein
MSRGPDGPSGARDWSTLQWSVRRRGDGEDFVEVILRGKPKEVHFFKIAGRDMVEKVVGHRLPMWRVADYLCAEFLSEFGDQTPMDWKPDEEELEAARALEGVEVPDEEGLREAGRRISETGGETDGGAPSFLPDPERAGSAQELLEILLALMALRQSLDWRTGQLLALCARRATLPDAEGILGLGSRKARELRGLYGRLEELPALRKAYRRGQIGGGKAWQLSRVCTRDTEAAWLEHAGEVTVRGLEAEVAGMEALREIDPAGYRTRTKGLPPDRALLEEWGVSPGGYKMPDLEKVADLRNHTRGVDPVLGPGWGRNKRFWAPRAVASFLRATIKTLQKLLGTLEGPRRDAAKRGPGGRSSGAPDVGEGSACWCWSSTTGTSTTGKRGR